MCGEVEADLVIQHRFQKVVGAYKSLNADMCSLCNI